MRKWNPLTLFKNKKYLLRMVQIVGLILFLATLYFVTLQLDALMFLVVELIIIYVFSFKIEKDKEEELIEVTIEAIENQSQCQDETVNLESEKPVVKSRVIDKKEIYLWLHSNKIINKKQFSHLSENVSVNLS